MHGATAGSRGGRPPAPDARSKLSEELPGASVFVLRQGEVFLTYSTFARGLDMPLTADHYLDLTPEARNEKAYSAWPRRHDEYPMTRDPSVAPAR